MSAAKITLGARTQLSGAAAALNSLANNTYVVLGTLVLADANGKVPLDKKVELGVTPGTVSAGAQASLFAQTSMDGTNFTTGPVSGASATDEANLTLIGAVPFNTSGVRQSKQFSLAAAFDGNVLPYAVKLIARNSTGAALASTGNDAYTQDANGDIT